MIDLTSKLNGIYISSLTTDFELGTMKIDLLKDFESGDLSQTVLFTGITNLKFHLYEGNKGCINSVVGVVFNEESDEYVVATEFYELIFTANKLIVGDGET